MCYAIHVLFKRLAAAKKLCDVTAELKCLLRWLPPCHLKSVCLKYTASRVTMVINKYEPEIEFDWRIDTILGAECKLFLSTSMITGPVLITTDTEHTCMPGQKEQKEQMKQHTDKSMKQFTEVEPGPCALLKQCILSIRQSMSSWRQEDFDSLQLPARPRSLVTFSGCPAKNYPWISSSLAIIIQVSHSHLAYIVLRQNKTGS